MNNLIKKPESDSSESFSLLGKEGNLSVESEHSVRSFQFWHECHAHEREEKIYPEAQDRCTRQDHWAWGRGFV